MPIEFAQFTPFGAPKKKRRGKEPLVPSLTPEEESSALGKLAGTALSGLSYIGLTLDKPGAAVRGFLAGDFSQLANLIPFSDALGITNTPGGLTEERVSGRDLLEQYGVLGKNTKGIDAGDVAGFGVDILTDPLTFLTLGGTGLLSQGGKIAAKAGKSLGAAAPKGLKANMTTTLRDVYRAADNASGLGSQGFDALENAARMQGINLVEEFMKPTSKLMDEPLRKGLFGGGLPFMDKMGFMSGPKGQAVAGFIDKWADKARYSGPGLKAAQLFHHPSGGLATKEGQQAAAGMTAAKDVASAEANKMVVEFANQLGAATEKLPADVVRQAMDALVEGFDVPEFLPGGLMNPVYHAMQLPELNKLRKIATEMRVKKDWVYERMVDQGRAPPELLDPMLLYDKIFGLKQHFPRYANPPRAKGWKGFTDALFKRGFDSDHARNTLLKNLPRSRETVNIIGLDEAVRTLPFNQAQEHVKDILIRQAQTSLNLDEQAEWIANLDPNHINLLTKWARGRPQGLVFEDALDDFARYANQGLQAEAGMKGAYDFIAKYATNKPDDLLLTGEKMVSVSEVLKKLNATTGGEISAGALKQLAARNMTQLDGMYLPKRLADDATRMIEGFAMPEMLKPVAAAVDMFTNSFKAGVTYVWPAFHTRNVATGMWMAFVGGAHDPRYNRANPMAWAKPWWDAGTLMDGGTVQGAGDIYTAGMNVRNRVPSTTSTALTKTASQSGPPAPIVHADVDDVMSIPPTSNTLNYPPAQGFSNRPLTDAEATRQLAEEAYANGLLSHTLAQDVSQQIMPGGQKLGPVSKGPKQTAFNILEQIPGAKPLNLGSVAKETFGPGGIRFHPFKGGRKASNLSEGYNRLAPYIALRRQGFSPAEAAARVKELNVDYSAFTGFEKNVMARLAPFYKFTKGILPVVLKELATRPGGPSRQAMRVGEFFRQEEGAFMPKHIGAGLAIPFGEETEGKQRYITQVDMPYEQLNLFSPQGIRQTGGNVLGMVNPLLKMPIEMVAGRSFFQDRDLRDIDIRTARILYEMGITDSPRQIGPIPVPAGRFVDQLLMNSPASRTISTIGQLVDERKGPKFMPSVPRAVNMITGLRMSDVDMEQAREIAVRDLIEERLRGQPGISVYESLYVSPENLGDLSVEDRALYQLLQTQKRRKQNVQRQEEKKLDKKQ